MLKCNFGRNVGWRLFYVGSHLTSRGRSLDGLERATLGCHSDLVGLNVHAPPREQLLETREGEDHVRVVNSQQAFLDVNCLYPRLQGWV